MFRVHAFFTKLVLALRALIRRLILNDRNDSITIFIGTHFQEWVIRNEIKFLHFIKQLPCFLVKSLEERSLFVDIDFTLLLWTFWEKEVVEFDFYVLFEAKSTVLMFTKTQINKVRF